MVGFLQLVSDQYTTLPIVPTPGDCVGKTFIVTGANTGLGFQCAQHLVRLSAARVILGVRSISKGDAAKASIENSTNRRGVVEVWQLDLASFDSVKAFVQQVKGLERLDALICNASVALLRYSVTEGLETSITVNVVNTMLLAVMALPALKSSAKMTGEKGHLVIVGSVVAFDCEGLLEGVEGDVLEGLKENKMYDRYPTTKLLQFYAARKLASLNPAEETGVIINYVNPGLCFTELARNGDFGYQVMIFIMRSLLGRTAEVGSRTLLHAAFAGEETHGKYLSACDVKEQHVAPWAMGESGIQMQERVWMDLTKRLNTIEPGCV